jgi:hypothetical protein
MFEVCVHEQVTRVCSLQPCPLMLVMCDANDTCVKIMCLDRVIGSGGCRKPVAGHDLAVGGMAETSVKVSLADIVVQLVLKDNGTDRQLRICSCGQNLTLHLPPEDHAQEAEAKKAQPSPAAPGSASACSARTAASGL